MSMVKDIYIYIYIYKYKRHKSSIDRQHKDRGVVDGNQHKYYSPLCCRPKFNHARTKSFENENIHIR